MRLFIAINFPKNVKDGLCADISALRSRALAGNFTRRENLHLTLAFLGETDASRLADARGAMDRVECGPFELEFSGFGSFGKKGDELFWRGAGASAELSGLARRLREELKDAGVDFDSKPFRPHITLVRRCEMEKGFSAADFEKSLSPLRFGVDSLSLMRSERLNGKLTYTEIYKRSFI